MKKNLQPYQRCPATGALLTLQNATMSADGGIVSGTLTSPDGREYRITDGVPVLLPSEGFKEGQRETVESFSAKWKLAPDYRRATETHYIQWYLERFGFGNVESLRKFLSDKRTILDAGAGHGRDAELFSKNSAAAVFAVDISYGIYNAFR